MNTVNTVNKGVFGVKHHHVILALILYCSFLLLLSDMQTPSPYKHRGISSPKHLTPQISSTPASAAAAIGRRNYLEEDEEDSVYNFKTPVRSNVNAALEVEASATFRNSTARKPPPPPKSPTVDHNMFGRQKQSLAYNVDDEEEFGQIETPPAESAKYLEVQTGSTASPTVSSPSTSQSLARRGLTQQKSVQKCPRCGKTDFDSKAIYNSHIRNCQRSPSTPKRMPVAGGGFGQLGLLMQIRRLQEEEERKRIEDREKAEAEAAAAKIREEEERRARIEAEKRRLVEEARKKKEMDAKRESFLNDLKEAAGKGNLEHLRTLLSQSVQHDVEAEHVAIRRANEVVAQLEELEELRKKVELARKQKEEEEAKAVEKERLIEEERKRRVEEFEKVECENDDDSDDEAVQQRRLEAQQRFEEKKRRRERRKGRKGSDGDEEARKKEVELDFAEEKKRALRFAEEDAARKEKLAKAQAEIEAERIRIVELNKVVELEKELERQAAKKKRQLEEEAREKEAKLAAKQKEIEEKAARERESLLVEKRKVEEDLAKRQEELEKKLREQEHQSNSKALQREAEIETKRKQTEEEINREHQRLQRERVEMEKRMVNEKTKLQETVAKELEEHRRSLEIERKDAELEMKQAKQEADMKAQEIAYQLEKMESDAREREEELHKRETEMHEKFIREAEEAKKTMVNEAREKIQADMEEHKNALSLLERERKLRIERETLALKEKQLAHEEAEKHALHAAERLRSELESKMQELSDKDERRKEAIAKQIQRYREESQQKIAEKEKELIDALSQRRAELEAREKEQTDAYEANRKKLEDEMRLIEQKKEEELKRRAEAENSRLVMNEEAIEAAKQAMKGLVDREAELKKWEEEIIRKTQEEAKSIRSAALHREEEAKEMEKRMLSDAAREAADRAAALFEARELEFKQKEQEMMERIRQTSLDIAEQQRKDEASKALHESLEARIQKKLDEMERRDEELRLREEKILRDKAVHEQEKKLLDEKEKLMNILQRGKQTELENQQKQFEQDLTAKIEQQIQEQKNLARLEAAAASANGKVHQLEELQQVSIEKHQTTISSPESNTKSPIETMQIFLRKLFSKWDQDQTGTITCNEFYEALMTLPQAPSDEVAQQLVSSMDKEGCGYINYEEFVQYYISEMEGSDNDMEQQNVGKDEHSAEGYGQIPCQHCADEPGAPATHAASAYGHTECLEALIASGANLGVLDRSNRTALFCAAANNQFNCVAVLLDGVDPNVLNHQDSRGDTALHAASCNGNDECLTLLLQAGAEPNFQNRKGHTPAHLAKDAKCLQSIYDHGGDVFALDNNERTAMFTSAAHGRIDVLSLLLDIDEDATMIDFVDARGDTPLHGAACNGHTEAVRVLLQTAADPNISNRMGFIAGYLAECNNHMDCVGLLEEYGGYKRSGLYQGVGEQNQHQQSTAEDVHEQLPQREYDLSKWSHAMDPGSGHNYYYHVETGETQWDEPIGYTAYYENLQDHQHEQGGYVDDGSNYYYQGGDPAHYQEYYQGYEGQEYTDWDYWYWYGYGAEEQEAARVQPEPEQKLNKDYVKMMTEYTNQAPYRGPANGNGEVPTCIICQQRPARDVFLPCEHTCVCKQCCTEHGFIGTKGDKKWKPKQCPVCKRRAYKAVEVSKYLTLPKDYGPAPKLSPDWVNEFKANTKKLRHENK